MDNKLICRNCGYENPFYQLTCSKCSAFLREKIFNIDLWDIIPVLIESPSKAFGKIIHSEHKNFTYFLFFFTAIKLSIVSIYISLAIRGNDHYMQSALITFVLSAGILFLITLLISVLFTAILKKRNIKTRLRDNLSITIYSLFPYIIGLVILFPLELILFGYTVFSVNPSPFTIKVTLAYTMLVFEILVIAWSVFLLFMAYRKQSGDNSIAAGFTLSFFAALFVLLTYTAAFIYVV